MYLFKNLITFVPEALFIISAVGYFERLSTFAMKYCSIAFSLSIGPPNSLCISSFGSTHFDKGAHLQCRITDFKFLPIYVQALHSLAFASICRWIYGHQILCAIESIAKLPG